MLTQISHYSLPYIPPYLFLHAGHGENVTKLSNLRGLIPGSSEKAYIHQNPLPWVKLGGGGGGNCKFCVFSFNW